MKPHRMLRFFRYTKCNYTFREYSLGITDYLKEENETKTIPLNLTQASKTPVKSPIST